MAEENTPATPPEEPKKGAETPPEPKGDGDGVGDGAGKGDDGAGASQPSAIDGLSHEELLKNPHYAGLHKELEEARKQKRQLETGRNAEEQKKLEEAGKFQDLYNVAKPKAERAEKLEEKVQNILDARIAQIPEDKRSLIPSSLAPEDQLEYIETNAALLFGSSEQDKGAGKVGAPNNPATDTGADGDSKYSFTGSQVNDPKFYHDHRDEIMQAQADGKVDWSK